MTASPGEPLIEAAFAACTALANAGETAVLCGGSAATFYVPNDYQSLDIDFVLHVGAAPHIVDRALAEIGFIRSMEGFYRHEHHPFTVEFPVGPLSIGREYVTTWRTEHRGKDLLHVLSPADVVRDRLLHYWAWSDRIALDAALAVTRARADVDVTAIRAWTAREQAADRSYDPRRIERYFTELSQAF
jgi:hypothetical protein